ncbi:hypothetical protein DPMN_071516 [Dreissena polymorpha]|uniref:Uncharacterized protein n=1 Tax=Dreissena polymorpha TaxID=45954 RepID=A0A9D4BPR0_DREPO|nr:hypothetical protein DPMN_071516 [Dreissena polymorpha]
MKRAVSTRLKDSGHTFSLRENTRSMSSHKRYFENEIRVGLLRQTPSHEDGALLLHAGFKQTMSPTRQQHYRLILVHNNLNNVIVHGAFSMEHYI